MSANGIDRFLELMVDRGASDLHLPVGKPPLLRINGEMDVVRYRTLSNNDFVSLLKPIVPKEEYWERFLTTGELDFSYEIPKVARFRVNCFMQENGFASVFRVIPSKIMTLTQLGMPAVLKSITQLRRGLVLVTGPTGSGKSTTLAAMINEINESRSVHLITVEDPVEFVHPPKLAKITQREIGTHARSFPDALKAAMREDPDLLLVGEMRDRQTIALALDAAASGLLVFGTLHTNSAAKTVDRIINVFPSSEQDGVRGVLAESLEAVVAQQLMKKVGGGRAAALEVMLGSQAMSTLIREGKTHQMTAYISTGKTRGMVTMDESILALLAAGSITDEVAYEKAIDKVTVLKHLKHPPASEDI
jgi:twitching motility protein PilT